MTRFDELDTDGSGRLDREDLEGMVEQNYRNLQLAEESKPVYHNETEDRAKELIGASYFLLLQASGPHPPSPHWPSLCFTCRRVFCYRTGLLAVHLWRPDVLRRAAQRRCCTRHEQHRWLSSNWHLLRRWRRRCASRVVA